MSEKKFLKIHLDGKEKTLPVLKIFENGDKQVYISNMICHPVIVLKNEGKVKIDRFYYDKYEFTN